jgi:hypothetical protein
MRGTMMTASWRLSILACVCTLGILCAARSAMAQVTLTEENSIVNIVTNMNNQAGMNSWTIDGHNVLAQQWFWYRVGPDPTGQHSLDTLPATYSLTDPADLKITFTGATFIVTANLSLVGSPSGNGTSDLSLQFKVKNTSGSSTNFHFYEYSNFVLGGPPGDTATFLNSNAVSQVGSLGSVYENAAATGGTGFSAPMHYEANVVSNTLNSLTGGSPYILNGNSSATGDVSWAFEWDLPIAGGATTQFSKDISIVVPEPSTVALVGVSLISMLALRRRRA